jgi:hypothetical protein
VQTKSVSSFIKQDKRAEEWMHIAHAISQRLSADSQRNTRSSRLTSFHKTLDDVGLLPAIDTRLRATAYSTSWTHSVARPDQQTDNGSCLAPLDGCAKVLLNGRPETHILEACRQCPEGTTRNDLATTTY